MKQWTVVISTLLLIGLVAGGTKAPTKDSEKTPDKISEKTLDKVSEKAYPKKVMSMKKRPTKAPTTKSAVESFKDLPDDDLDFIKELDKQFKLHGDKIKIKVERDNSTKNSKRTVEGDLGYGYYNGEQGNGYSYPRPKFEFYPYSQQDIPASAPGYQIKDDEEQSTVSIIPSLSYEIKQTPGRGYETNAPYTGSQPAHQEGAYQPQQEEQAYQGYQQQQHEEPVIVLRIPGPSKYASHLQALLQQYLEVRASQYLKILEEAELQKQQQQHEQVEYQDGPQQGKPLEEQYQQAEPQYQQPETQYQQQEPQYQQQAYAQQQQEPSYPGIADVYQSYKGRHQESTPIEEQQYEVPAEYTHQQPPHEEQQQFFYMPMQQEQPSQGYQPIYYVAMPQSDYGYPESYAPAVPEGYVDDGHLPIAENNPRSTHTKVLFTEGSNKDFSTQYPLPSIKPFERHAPTQSPTPVYEDYQNEGASSDYQQQDQYQYSGQASQSQPVVSITQRPYNYHAHSLHAKNTKRNAAPAPSDNLKRLHAMINRLRTPQPHALSRTQKEAA